MKNVSPLRYPGGKTRACKFLEKVVEENYPNPEKVISPFFGGGSFEFYLSNKYGSKIIANDKFTPLANFWKICKIQNKELCEKLYTKLGNVKKEDFLDLREKIMNEENDLSQAFMYFIINRCSFSGATLSGGFSSESSKKRFTKSSIERVGKLNLDNFEIYNLDFEDFLNENTEGLIFLDPPYYLEKGSKLYGKNGDMHENFDHLRLFECLRTRKNWILTYNNCDYIKELYSKYKIIETSWSYGMNKSKQSSEIVILG